MTMSKVEECRGDSHETRLSQGQVIQPAKNSTKPLKSFNIADILGVSSPAKPVDHESHPVEHNNKQNSKINRSTSPDHPEIITQRSKDFSKHHHNNNPTADHLSDDGGNTHTNGKRRMQDTLHIFNNLAKSPRNGKTADEFRNAAAAAVASMAPNNFFSSPFGCFPKTLLQGFLPPFNINHNHLAPPPHPHHPHPQPHLQHNNIISHSDHHSPNHHPHPNNNSNHHHHPLSHSHPHHQQHQQHHQQHQHTPHSPTFLHGPVNLSLNNNNSNNSNHNHNNNNNNNVKIVRPWDDASSCHDTSSPPLHPKTPPVASSSLSSTSTTMTRTTITSEDSYDDEDEDEEISVDDEDPPVPPTSGKKVKAANGEMVSPLDALMAMTSKTFAGLDNTGGVDPKRKDQQVMFGKHQPPKKRRKSRTAFTNQQIYELEKRFLYQKYLTPADRDEIAINLGLTNAQVITWFQNRRAKLKRDLEELKNDVTASKKLPIPRNITGSVTEIELRRIQERTLRESFQNGGLQSPSSCSMASLSDDHDVSTPIHSPDKSDSDKIHVDVISSDPMDSDYSTENNGRIEGHLNHRHSTDVHNNDANEINDNSLSHRQGNENSGSSVTSECGSRCEIDNQKKISGFSLEVSPGLV